MVSLTLNSEVWENATDKKLYLPQTTSNDSRRFLHLSSDLYVHVNGRFRLWPNLHVVKYKMCYITILTKIWPWNDLK